MTDERFNELLNGPLAHPLILMRINRLAMALRYVVDAVGEDAEQALEDHCAERQRRDEEDAKI